MKHKKLSFFNTLLLLMIFSNSIAEPKKITGEPEKKQFTFSWQFIDSDTIRPRGGTTKGTTVEISQSASASWQKLSNNDLSKFDKDVY